MPKPKLAQPLPSIRVRTNKPRPLELGMSISVEQQERETASNAKTLNVLLALQDAQRWKQINLGIHRHGDERTLVTPTRPTMSVLMNLDIVR